MMNARVEMNEKMMAQVNGGNILDYINDVIHFDPVDVLFPESPEEKKERKETREKLFDKIKDIIPLG